ncbi:MAG TPA: hydrogenase maturation protease [Pyrinomonadaceae bacterium]|nr:hydrogenase maturation protease [Pyrinomonadaceae bacterium]
MNEILIACLGNIFYGDDAFGVEVAKLLSEQELPENVKLIDFGIRGIDLAFELINDYELVILVDTIKIGAEAGSVFVLEPKLSENGENFTHDLTPTKAMHIASRLKTKPKKMLLVGCEPVNLEFNDEISEAVEIAIEKAVEKILEIIEKEKINRDERDEKDN